MRKVSFDYCGEADVLQIKEMPYPHIKGKNKVLVKTLYSSLNAVDWKYRRGYFRFVTQFLSTNLGYDIVGEIVEKSDNLSNYRIGDIIIGLLPTLIGGTHSEYVVLTLGQFVVIPSIDDLKEIAGLPMAGVTAWMALVKKANIKEGQKVLINGGSSGVGHLAIQLAKIYGAEVTSISSGRNEDFCRSIGADHTINYQQRKISSLDDKYDIFFDVVSNSSIREVKPILNTGGVYVDTNISFTLIRDMLFNSHVKFVYVHPHVEALTELLNFVMAKILKVHIDKVFKFEEIIEAHQYIEKSRTVGKVIIEFDK
ncbi:zinc-binding dehydrogenase [Bacteroides fragilis]|uniref:NAD(P)-dependent alcohol dehydrogenase n=1 Tax=Bacteroides thetaiotaomicron TaxID=818 RepID=UPI0029DD5680|nr:NAD(P)-dependent alcohol dehydrogenase [Bacteroides fragilis]MCE8655298.1 NAD(P)-dependent alcohol dehydrogenase [Bacteroides fragilis]